MAARAPAVTVARTRRYDPAETRQRVLEAANMLFSTKGFVSTGTADIAREADVSEGSIFYHFGSKKALLVELGRMYGERMVACMQHPDEDIAELPAEVSISRCFEYCSTNKTWEKVMSGGEERIGQMGVNVHAPEAEPFYRASREVVLEWTERHLAAITAKRARIGINLPVAASLMYAVVHDALDRAFAPGTSPEERDAIRRETIRFIDAAVG